MRELTFDNIIREVSKVVEIFAKEQGREPTKLKLTHKIYNGLKQFKANQIPRWADSKKLLVEGVEGAFTRWPGIDTRNDRVGFYDIIGWDAEKISVE